MPAVTRWLSLHAGEGDNCRGSRRKQQRPLATDMAGAVFDRPCRERSGQHRQRCIWTGNHGGKAAAFGRASFRRFTKRQDAKRQDAQPCQREATHGAFGGVWVWATQRCEPGRREWEWEWEWAGTPTTGVGGGRGALALRQQERKKEGRWTATTATGQCIPDLIVCGLAGLTVSTCVRVAGLPSNVSWRRVLGSNQCSATGGWRPPPDVRAWTRCRRAGTVHYGRRGGEAGSECAQQPARKHGARQR